ncbi:MAG: Maf family protein, partial [Eubacteriales bacterium]|nr:Maf family protein [Eubacteriales bacterium]
MIILASASPRRKELLTMAGIEYTCIPSDAEEIVPEDLTASAVPEYLSGIKAGSVFSQHPDDIVIGSDTIVYIDGKILGKPAGKDEAFQMLKMLSGRTHTVYTGVTILSPGKEDRFTSATEVEFYELSDEEILTYIDTGEPMDKAGSYGIQGYGAVLV